jgi:AAA domain/Bifunctional DNA primase/polymerase, N-terminal
MADPVAAAPAGSLFDDHAPLYRAARYRVVPIAPGTKYPGVHQGFGSYIALVGWPTSHVTDPQPGAGIGLICGDPLIAADIDTDDESLGVELIDALTDGSGTTITKAGKRGQTLLLRPPPDVKVRSRKFLINGATAFEMLADGRQTVLPPTIHPDLKKPYRWGNGATPLNTELAQIALLRSDWEERVEAVLAKYGYEPEPPKDEQRSFDETSPFQQINNLAMANLPDWVPALNLYSCHRGRGFQNYEAIAIWRPSQNPLEERRANLKISSKGIVDFGTGKGYSPLDLVMASRACSLNEAFDWLTAQLAGREANPTVVDFEPAKPSSEPEPQQPRGYRFKLVAFNDMKPGLEQLYLVDELIPIAGLVDIWGKPKCFKSFWTLDLMFHVAMGWEYRDRSIQQGAVVYCAFEGAHGYKKRIEAIRRHYELEEEHHVPLYVMPGQANLIADHKTLIADITGQLGDTKPICVVLDTLNKSLMGSESKDTDMSAYVRAAEAIRDAFKCVVIIVHHCGLDDTRPRGHTSLPGAVDAQLAVAREGNAVTVTVEMMRDGPEETVVTSMVEVVEVGQDSAGKILTSLVVKPGETPVGGHTKGEWTGALKTFRKALSEALLETDEKIHVDGFVTRAADLEQVRKHYYTTCVADGATQEEKQDTRRKRFLRCVERAQQANLIGVRVEPNGRTLLWLPHPEPQKEEM